MFQLDLAGASILLGLIGIAAALFVGLPLKRKIERLDRSIAEHEAREKAAGRL